MRQFLLELGFELVSTAVAKGCEATGRALYELERRACATACLPPWDELPHNVREDWIGRAETAGRTVTQAAVDLWRRRRGG